MSASHTQTHGMNARLKSPSSPAGSAVFSLKAPRQPMLWACLAYSCGIVVGIREWRPALWWVLAGLAFTLVAMYFAGRRAKLGWLLAFAVFFVAGSLHVQVRSTTPRLDTSILPFADRQPVEITGYAIKDGRLRQNGFEAMRQAVDLQVTELRVDAGRIPVSARIRLQIYDRHAAKSASMRNLQYGENVRCIARLRRPRNFRNPGAFDYEGYLADRGIAAIASANMQDVEVLPGFTGSSIEAWRSRLHRGVIAKVHQLWPADDAALIDAMIIGEDAFIDRDTRTDFQRSGTYHVLVVSGMNVSILAFVVYWSLRRLRLSEIPATLGTIAGCIGYAFLTDVGAPVWRATLMFAI